MLGAGPAWGREDADGTILRGGILYEKVLELLKPTPCSSVLQSAGHERHFCTR